MGSYNPWLALCELFSQERGGRIKYPKDEEVYGHLKAALKEIVADRHRITEPLFKTLGKIISGNWSFQNQILACSLMACIQRKSRISDANRYFILDKILSLLMRQNAAGAVKLPWEENRLCMMHEVLKLLLSWSSNDRGVSAMRELLLYTGTIKKVLQIVCLPHHSDKHSSCLYHYQTEQILAVEKKFQGKCVDVTMKLHKDQESSRMALWSYLNADNNGSYTLCLQEDQYLVEMLVPDEGMAASDWLCSEKHTWHNPDGNVFEQMKSEELDEVNIKITQVVNPQLFFAHIDEEASKISRQVSEEISKVYQSETCPDFLSKPPKYGTMVCGKKHGYGYFRGQVVKSDDTIVTLFLIDYGHVVTLEYNDVFELKDMPKVFKTPPQATLCQLTGVVPKPVGVFRSRYLTDSTIVFTGLQIVCNLTYGPSRNRLDKDNNIDRVLRTLKASWRCDPDVAVVCLKIIGNFMYYTLNIPALVRNHEEFLNTLLEIIKEYACDHADKAVMVTTACLSLLAGLLRYSEVAIATLLQRKVGVTLAMLGERDDIPQDITKRALQALQILTMKPTTFDNSFHERSRSRGRSVGRRTMSPLRSTRDCSRNDDFRRARSMTRQRTHSQGPGSPVENYPGFRSDRRRGPPFARCPHCTFEYNTPHMLDERLSVSEAPQENKQGFSETDLNKRCLPATLESNKKFEKMVLIKGGPSPFKDSKIYMNWYDAGDFLSMYRGLLGGVLTAFLNSDSGGHILFGLSFENRVIGKVVFREQRDRYGNEVRHQVLCHINPKVIPGQVKVNWHPVKEHRDVITDPKSIVRFVVDIEIQPNNGQSTFIYSGLKQTVTCYRHENRIYRYVSETLQKRQVNLREHSFMSELAHLEELDKAKREILRLRKQVAELKQFRPELPIMKNRQV